MQSRLCSTLSNRSISFQGRGDAYRSAKAGMPLLTAVRITAPTVVRYAVTTYCCLVDEGPHRERLFWKDRNGIGTTVLRETWRKPNSFNLKDQRVSWHMKKLDLENHYEVRGSSELVPRGLPFRGESWQEEDCHPLPSPRSTGSTLWTAWPTPCKKHCTQDEHLDRFPWQCSLIELTNVHFFSCGLIQITLFYFLTHHQYLLKHASSDKQTRS